MPTGGKPQIEEIGCREVEPYLIPDPGDAGAISVARGGYCELTTTGAETRTLADPVYKGQTIDLVFITDGGDCVITAASAINQAGNTIMTFADVGDHIRLIGAWNATDGFEWKTVAAGTDNGVALS
jgi:hypothetical protein